MQLEDIDLSDGRNFVRAVPHEWFRRLRQDDPVCWHPMEGAPRGGFWCVTDYEDCVAVNRDWEHFSSFRGGALFQDMDQANLDQQRLMMLNMDPSMHTRYRRLVNKGFTPKMIRDLRETTVRYADRIIDAVCERGTADFVEEIAAELPLLVIAEILGVPQEDRRRVFDWSNRMIGNADPEYQVSEEAAGEAAMQVYAYADELSSAKRLSPADDVISVLLDAEVDGEKLDQMEIDLFFLLLIVAGNETTRNLMSGAMAAFFDHPDQWQRLLADRSLLPTAVEEMLRFVTPVMHFRRTATEDCRLGDQEVQEGDKVVFWHISANRDESVFGQPDAFDVGRDPNPHIAFGGGGPHFCLGANLARMEITIMFDRLLDRLPDIRLDGEVQRLQSNFINGTKHLPVAFTPLAPLAG
ncbi:MAG: cytochrome P450 [Acidimicrobiales bacterium]